MSLSGRRSLLWRVVLVNVVLAAAFAAVTLMRLGAVPPSGSR